MKLAVALHPGRCTRPVAGATACRRRWLPLLLALASAGGLLSASSPLPADVGASLEMAAQPGHVIYRCPMHPQVMSEVPGRCPICGMDLVAANDAVHVDHGSGITLDSALIQRLGVRTDEVVTGRLEASSKAAGYIEFDESQRRAVPTPLAGTLLRLAVSGEGALVEPGTVLFEISVPSAIPAQTRLAAALGARDEAAAVEARAALSSLGIDGQALGVIESQRWTDGRVPVLAPQSGQVADIEAQVGASLAAGAKVMELADPKSLLVRTEVVERDAPWISIGLPVDITVPTLPGHRFAGTVHLVGPSMDQVTRALRIKVRVANEGLLLHPNQIASVVIRRSEPELRLHVPRSAVIRDGSVTRVIVALGAGRFEPRTVTVGDEYGERVVVTSGLAAGEQVVTAAQFLIDAEASLTAALQRLDGSGKVDGMPPSEATGAGH